MGFEDEHEKWYHMHLSKRSGERKDALRRGHGFGNQLFVEKIWWPLMGHFEGLHPEYEVKDSRGKSYFVDFLWKVGGHGIVFEIMDFGSHGQDRTKYRMDLNRALYLQSQQYQYVAIPLDELKENPRSVKNLIRQILAPYLSADIRQDGHMSRRYGKIERELMRLAIRQNRVLRPAKAAKELELHKSTIIKYCRILVEKGKFRAVPAGRSGRVNRYEYLGSVHSADLL
jgi:very-short-patch-repair endonuclease